MTTIASGPYLEAKDGAGSASTAAPYSMQPFSAWTLGTLARKCLRTSSRLPGLVVRTATTWIMRRAPWAGSPLGLGPPILLAGAERLGWGGGREAGEVLRREDGEGELAAGKVEEVAVLGEDQVGPGGEGQVEEF